MHFRTRTVIVVREFVASRLQLSPEEVTSVQIKNFTASLAQEYSGVMDVTQCIFLVVCGRQADDDLAVKTVHWWLSNVDSLTKVIFPNEGKPRATPLKNGVYPRYCLQETDWRSTSTSEPFQPTAATLAAIRGVLAQFCNPERPNSVPSTRPKKNKRVNLPPRRPPTPPQPQDAPQLQDAPQPQNAQQLQDAKQPQDAQQPQDSQQPQDAKQPQDSQQPQDAKQPQDAQQPQDIKPQDHNPDPQPDVPILSPGMPVNAISKGYPYLAGVVDSVSGVIVTVHFPYLKKNASCDYPRDSVQPFRPQIVNGKVQLLLPCPKNKKKAFSVLIKRYEEALILFLEAK